MITVVLDAGHGPETQGKRTPRFEDGSFMHEHSFNYAVVTQVAQLLQHSPCFKTEIVSDPDRDTPLQTRVNRENALQGDIFISVHANALSDSWNNAHGIETFFNKGSINGKKYGNVIQQQLIRKTARKDRGLKMAPGPLYPKSLFVLKNTKAPAVLVECGFMDNREEARLLMSAEYRKNCAEAIVSALHEIFSQEESTIDYKKLYEEAQAKLDAIHSILK